MNKKVIIIAIIGFITCVSIIFATIQGKDMQVRRQLQRRVRRLEDLADDIDKLQK